jgi:hypothetical protein
MCWLLGSTGFAILAAEEMPWWFPWGAAGLGVILICTGAYQIKTRRAKAARGLTRMVMRLFGYKEMTGKLAAFNGYMNAGSGVVLILAAPFLSKFVGILKPAPPAQVVAAQAPAAAAKANEAAAEKNATAEVAQPNPGEPVAPRRAESLGKPAVALPAWSVPASPTAVVIKARREETFRDIASDGGVLVGLSVVQGAQWGGAVRAIRPIYQLGGEYRVGEWCGEPGEPEHLLLAKPGHVVTRIDARAGLAFNKIRLQFSPVRGAELDSSQSYYSDWVGSEGGNEIIPSGEPALITGVSGESNISMRGLTYYTIPPTFKSAASNAMPKAEPEEHPKELPKEEPKVEPVRPEASRIWTSSNGRFTFEAVLIGMDGEQAVLKASDGREVNVGLDRLSSGDQEYIKQWRAADKSRQ